MVRRGWNAATRVVLSLLPATAMKTMALQQEGDSFTMPQYRRIEKPVQEKTKAPLQTWVSKTRSRRVNLAERQAKRQDTPSLVDLHQPPKLSGSPLWTQPLWTRTTKAHTCTQANPDPLACGGMRSRRCQPVHFRCI
ncbi:hypothetical protein BT67DRAFT_28697 [Trichocladium antarcticum]|uniref:Secreted protein n=1 Tax=Trichocladium antarcticum TaxID=1450529 RepID=A0AAN6ZIM4_9PEZI|nr:hypothetical protein BT67DRAFT_28697 [Trichocladium antarcticum]